MVLGALLMPAALPSFVVVILESMCFLSLAGGSAIFWPSSLASASVSSSNITSSR